MYSDKEKQKQYMYEYWSKPENKERNRLNSRKNYRENKRQLVVYWRKKYMKQFACLEKDIAHLTIEQMKEDCKTGLCRV